MKYFILTVSLILFLMGISKLLYALIVSIKRKREKD